MSIRPAAVAGTWYPGTPGALAREVDGYLDGAAAAPAGSTIAIVSPHAGIMFSGATAAYAYKAASASSYDVAVLVGPSHFVAFEGVAIYPDGAFAMPFGPVPIASDFAAAISRADIVKPLTSAHAREHSLEMQLPFLVRALPRVPIVPLLIGHQSRSTIEALAAALAEGVRDRRALLIASTDLSHYFDASTAAALDGAVSVHMAGFDTAALLDRFESYPEGERGRSVGCGMGAAIAVMMAAEALGARDARVLRYAHSGEVSGDYGGVVGYLAAAFGNYQPESEDHAEPQAE
jgi:AmmeMemoRadiSam system protein B